MTKPGWKTVGLLPLVFLLFAPPSMSQQTSNEELSKQIKELNRSMKAMQKDLQEIKALLQGRAQAQPAPPPRKILLDLEGRPGRGENTAKLTMVEFSDYE